MFYFTIGWKNNIFSLLHVEGQGGQTDSQIQMQIYEMGMRK